MRLLLPASLRQEIVGHVERAWPQEGCGLLLGVQGGAGEWQVSALLPSSNLAADPRTGFEIDPPLLMKAQREARHGGPSVIGHYHSHPNGSAIPSARDAEARGYYPNHLWLIAGVVEGVMENLTAWHPNPSEPHFTAITLTSL